MRKFMNQKIKILMGVLVVGITLAGGYLIWNINKTSEMNVVCMPRYCCTLYCENKVNLSNWYKCKVFAKVCRPPSPRCPGGTSYYIRGKIVSREEFLQKIREKNEICNNCLTPVPVPCR